ncbi:Metacaspase-1 [Durusdinium trenchii]|uniref:Metacaspase-1 n=1 Tax=Durusdinium trenchii TaxID=1381693 RepID=A0ABP0QMI9_9DINO
MPLVLEVLCGRHFFVQNPNCFCKFTYGGQEYSTDADQGATNPKWQKNKFQVEYTGGTLEIDFEVMNRLSRQESIKIASVTIQWHHFLPGLRKVEDYIMATREEGVKETAAIRVAATLIPEGITGEPAREKPNCKGLFIGCSYPKTSMALGHCAEDAYKIKEYLCEKWGFINDSEHVRVLMDLGDTSESTMPTKSNIRDSISWLVHEAVPGDSLLFFFSGHGTQVPNFQDDEKDGKDEAIVPVDVDESGPLIDDELHELLVKPGGFGAREGKPLAAGVRLTCLLDCCHAGTGLDLAYRWSPYMEKGTKEEWEGKWQVDKGGFYADADVICISGCDDNQVSVGNDALAMGPASPMQAGFPVGMFLASFCVALEVHETQCKMNWMEMMDIVMQDFHFKQEPQLSSSQRFDLHREFSFHDSIPNSNERTGAVGREAAEAEGGSLYRARNLLATEDFAATNACQMMQALGVVRPEDLEDLKKHGQWPPPQVSLEELQEIKLTKRMARWAEPGMMVVPKRP